MQRPCRVFISHSANAVDEPATQRFLDTLIAKVRGTPGLEALADQRDLQAGDDWLQRLYSWMGLCDAAVIVLSPRAIKREHSSWVPREASLLLWRKALDERFVVIPVLIGGLKASDLAGNPFVADLRLNDLQLAAGLSDKKKITAIVEALLNKLATLPGRQVFDPLRVHVEDCLQRYAPDASVSDALACHYGADPWQPYVQPRQNLSVKMVRQASAETVDVVIRDVARGSQGDARLAARLFEALFPMRLPAQSACNLLAMCGSQEGRGSVLVNSYDTWAVRMLLRAATGLPKDDLPRTWQLIELPDGWGDNDLHEVTLFLAAELAEAALGTGGWELLSEHPDPVERLKEQLAALATQLLVARGETGAPIVVCARYTRRWVELASLLAARFPTTVFLFWTGDSAGIEAMAGADCVVLDPSWPAGADRRWRLDYRRKMTQLGGLAE